MTDQECPFGHGVSRRGLLGRALGAAAGAAGAGALAFAGGTAYAGESSPSAHDSADAPSGERSSYPFEGAHQQGIITEKQRQAAFLSLDVTATSRQELRDLLRTITDQARLLTSGGTTPNPGLVETEPDGGILGPTVPADGLTVTLGVGASLFDERFGLAPQKPARLSRMAAFPNDALDPALCHGDLMLQLGANNTDTVLHAMRQITRETRGAMQIRWRQDGFQSPPRPSGTPRNLLGFKDGTGNPATDDAALMDQLVWTKGGGAEPAWVDGGSYQAVRIIRMLVEFWDRVSILEQERIFGRAKDTGAPLSGNAEFDTVLHAMRQITRETRGAMQIRWRQDGFQSPPRPSGTPRNLLGFKDGTGNPSAADTALMDQLVWTKGGGAEPAWVEGGSYQAVRIIRMLVEFWDRVSILEQERMFGRAKDTGAPLSGNAEFDTPVYDQYGDSIAYNAHIRLANPRQAGTEDQRPFRRSFNYDNGVDPNGNLDMGHLFVAFNQDLERQFITVQKRLVDEPLVDYVSPIGGGYFFALPGVRGSDDWLGRGMFA